MKNAEEEAVKSQKRMGFGMVLGMWILALAILTYFFGIIAENMHNPNQSVNTRVDPAGVKEVVLKRNNRGHYVTTGQINGTPISFMLDTGASDVALPEHIANSLGLKRGMEIQYHTANGTARGYATRLDSVSVGDITLYDVKADIAPGYQGDEVLLGMSFLKLLEFTQRGDELTIRQYPQ